MESDRPAVRFGNLTAAAAMSLTETLGVHLSKIPGLDKEDLKAVRSSVPGKLLIRTAGLLWVVLLVLGYAGAVDQGLKRLLDVDLSPTPSLQRSYWKRSAVRRSGWCRASEGALRRGRRAVT